MEVFIGKQPILNNFEQTVAYELLYRNKNLNVFPTVNQDEATIEVIINAFLTFGIQTISDNKPVFINFSENLIMHDFMFQLDAKNIVIEILETVHISPKIIERLQQLKESGYKIALDDYVFDPENPLNSKLFQIVDIIKVDFLNTPKPIRLVFDRHMRRFFPFITLLAEKVETRAAYEEAVASGYTLFQGYFFEQPKVLISKDIQPNTMHYFEIMAILQSEEPDIEEISETIERDISLTYKLLKLVNKTDNRIRSPITSIQQAIMTLGLIELQKWIYLLAIRSNQTHISNDELIYISLFRSKVCEMLARQKGFRNYPEFYLAGMFSNVDAILQVPMVEIVHDLPFSPLIIQTIMNEETAMTPYLQLAISLQKLDWDTIVLIAADLDVSLDNLEILYHSTNEWVGNIFSNNLLTM